MFAYVTFIIPTYIHGTTQFNCLVLPYALLVLHCCLVTGTIANIRTLVACLYVNLLFNFALYTLNCYNELAEK